MWGFWCCGFGGLVFVYSGAGMVGVGNRVGWLTWMLAFTGTCAVWFSVYIGVFSGTASLGVCDMAGGD